MQKITPCLWFDDKAEEAVNLYTSIFEDSKIMGITRYGEAGAGASGRPKGTVMTVSFQLGGHEFLALNGGPYFTHSPAISFFVTCETRKDVDKLWEKLSERGTVLMELEKYPFSERFGWLADKFGVSWQVNLAGRKQKITPFLLFVGEQHGKAEEAANFYVSLFKNSCVVKVDRYGAGEDEPEGTVRHATFSLHGQEFMGMDSHLEHAFTFTPAISFIVNCETQEEVDGFWAKLSDGGATEQCGWLRDKYGMSWQIVPTVLGELLQDKDVEKSESVMKALIQMNKLDIKTLKQAYAQR